MVKEDPPILLSACLLGENCRYNGKSSLSPSLLRELKGRRMLAVCPEQLGGLGTPRPPAEITGGDGRAVLMGAAGVKNKHGEDVTAFFRRGAEKTWELAQREGVKEAILKDKSPSCGKNYIYDGTFQGRLRPGLGVTAALLKGKGVALYTETEWPPGESDQVCRKKS